MKASPIARAAVASLVWFAIAAPLSPLTPAAPAGSQKTEVVRGHLMPFKCQNDEKVSHTRECALRPECEITGYGLALADGTFLQFDAESNKKAGDLLRASKQTNDLKAEAEGERVGPLFRVRTLQLK